MSNRRMPAQKPGKSEQAVCTPPEFLSAVVNMFGDLDFDLAALETNRVYGLPYFGPDHPAEECRDGLAATWPYQGLAWCNPPFGNIQPWAETCARVSTLTALHTLMLVPASVGANWYRDYVAPFADVYSIGRLTFVGHSNPTPKDLILCHYWRLGGQKFTHWAWRK